MAFYGSYPLSFVMLKIRLTAGNSERGRQNQVDTSFDKAATFPRGNRHAALIAVTGRKVGSGPQRLATFGFGILTECKCYSNLTKSRSEERIIADWRVPFSYEVELCTFISFRRYRGSTIA